MKITHMGDDSLIIKITELEDEFKKLQNEKNQQILNEIMILRNENKRLKKFNASKIKYSNVYCNSNSNQPYDEVENSIELNNIKKHNSFTKFFCLWKC